MLLALAVSALAFNVPSPFTRRDALFAGASAAAVAGLVPPAFADGSTSLVTLQKARLTYGQVVLALVDASPETILANKNAILLYVSAIERAKGKKTDPRKGAANDIITAAKVIRTSCEGASAPARLCPHSAHSTTLACRDSVIPLDYTALLPHT